MSRRSGFNPCVGAAAIAAAVLVSRCRTHEGVDVAWTIRLPVDVPLDPAKLAFEPASAVRAAHLFRSSELAVVATSSVPRVTLRAPGLCPVELDTARGGAEISAKPWLDVGGDRPPVGFDAAFELVATPGCADGRRGQVTWRQIAGPPLAEPRVDEGGFRFRARTLPREKFLPDPLPWGIVPVSPRTQGRYVLEVTWTGQGAPVRRTVTITSTSRATGIATLSIGQRVLLGGADWRVEQAPSGGSAQVNTERGAAWFEPDAPGHWALQDASGRGLGLSSGRYDEMPLDCGRDGCHGSLVAATTSSPMTSSLETHARAGAVSDCMLDCHVTGQRGLRDGGFLDLARTLPFRVAGAAWRELPRALRRVGGVTCTACHGPAAIPQPDARQRVLSADVCATCHDSPPEYVTVEKWRTSRMSRSDAEPQTRTDAACARCHTTAGFLASIGVRKLASTSDATVSNGVACAACHAPHAAHLGQALVRAVAIPDSVAGPGGEQHAASAVCLRCHAPGPDEDLPSASAGALWLGRVVLPSGERVTGPAQHESIAAGCVGCHGGPRPTDHSFRVELERCAACHQTEARENPDALGRTIRERALWLAGRLGLVPIPGAPLHAAPAPTSPDALRARYELALVLEDPAAAIHNAAFARELLDDAEQSLDATSPYPE